MYIERLDMEDKEKVATQKCIDEKLKILIKRLDAILQSNQEQSCNDRESFPVDQG